MTKLTVLILSAFLTSTALAANLEVKSSRIGSSPMSSQQAWESLPNRLESRWLDQLPHLYPRTTEAVVAFTLRYRIVQGINTVSAYQNFIDTYPRTLAAQEAQYALLQFYGPDEQLDRSQRLVGYLAFAFRYPNTPLALVAKASAEQVAFEEVVETNEVGEYEDFMQIFPNAPQVSAAEKLAREKAVEKERADIEAEIAPFKQRKAKYEYELQTLEQNSNIDDTQTNLTIAIQSLDAQIKSAEEDRARELGTEFEIQAKEITSNPQHPDIQEKLRVSDRLAYIIQTVYPKRNATRRVRLEERHQEIIAKLEQIRQTIKAENTRLIEALQQEFAKTRQLIEAGFDQLHRDNRAAEKSLNALLDGVAQLHQTLQETNAELRGIKLEVKQVGEYVKRGNELLTVIHNDLGQIQGQLVKLNHDMNRNSQQEQGLLKGIAGNLDAGFDRLQGSFDASTKAIVNSQTQIRQAIHQQTDVIYKSTDLILNESRQTRKVINDLGQKMNRYISKHQQSKKEEECGFWCRAAKVVGGTAKMLQGDFIEGTERLYEGVTGKDI